MKESGTEQGKASFIQTVSGIMIDPLSPDPSLICIDDIAHALSNQGRFTGHTQSPALFGRDFYSVAEHSVHVAELVEERYKLAALLHDASEAFLSDIASPVKHSEELTPYREVEKNLQLAVYKAFGLPYIPYPSIKTADLYMLGIEARDLMRGCQGLYWREYVRPIIWHPLSVRRPWSPRKAKREFLDMFYKITR